MAQCLSHQMRQLRQVDAALVCNRAAAGPISADPPSFRCRQSNGIDNDTSPRVDRDIIGLGQLWSSARESDRCAVNRKHWGSNWSRCRALMGYQCCRRWRKVNGAPSSCREYQSICRSALAVRECQNAQRRQPFEFCRMTDASALFAASSPSGKLRIGFHLSLRVTSSTQSSPGDPKSSFHARDCWESGKIVFRFAFKAEQNSISAAVLTWCSKARWRVLLHVPMAVGRCPTSSARVQSFRSCTTCD